MSDDKAFLSKTMFGTDEQERERFRKTADAWLESGKPLRLHLGFIERSPSHANALALKARLEWKRGQRTDAAETARRAIDAGARDGGMKEAMQEILAKA